MSARDTVGAMHVSTVLVLLLVVSAILGVAGSVRRRDRVGYVLSVAILFCASAGIWRYWRQRALVTKNQAELQDSFDAFMAVRHVPSGATLATTLTLEIPCAAMGTSLRQAICDERRNVEARALSRAAYDDLARGLTGAVSMDVGTRSPAGVRYTIGTDVSRAILATDPTGTRLLMTLPGTAAPPEHSPSTPAFIDLAGADIRLTIAAPVCTDGHCTPASLHLTVGTQRYCVSSFIRRSDAFAGRLTACTH